MAEEGYDTWPKLTGGKGIHLMAPLDEPMTHDRAHARRGSFAAHWPNATPSNTSSPRRARAARTRAQTPALLKGLIFGPNGVPMTPTHSRKDGKLYRYYIATSALRSGIPDASPIRRIPSSEIEAAVVRQIKRMAQSPEIVVATWRVAKAHINGLTEQQVRSHLHSFTELWSELFPAEQARIVQLLVARVDVSPMGADITLKTEGLGALLQDLQGEPGLAGDSRIRVPSDSLVPTHLSDCED